MWRSKNVDIVNLLVQFTNEQREQNKKECELTDVEVAKLKAKVIREEGQLKYNLKLLNELEADKSRKLMVVNVLGLVFLLGLAALFVFYEHALNNHM